MNVSSLSLFSIWTLIVLFIFKSVFMYDGMFFSWHEFLLHLLCGHKVLEGKALFVENLPRISHILGIKRTEVSIWLRWCQHKASLRCSELSLVRLRCRSHLRLRYKTLQPLQGCLGVLVYSRTKSTLISSITLSSDKMRGWGDGSRNLISLSRIQVKMLEVVVQPYNPRLGRRGQVGLCSSLAS